MFSRERVSFRAVLGDPLGHSHVLCRIPSGCGDERPCASCVVSSLLSGCVLVWVSRTSFFPLFLSPSGCSCAAGGCCGWALGRCGTLEFSQVGLLLLHDPGPLWFLVDTHGAAALLPPGVVTWVIGCSAYAPSGPLPACISPWHAPGAGLVFGLLWRFTGWLLVPSGD